MSYATLSPPTQTAAAVAARTLHATKVYGDGSTAVTALDDVSVDLPAGRFTAIMGPSGSGKSTLLHVIAGLDTLTSGQVFVGGTDLSTLNDRRLTAYLPRLSFPPMSRRSSSGNNRTVPCVTCAKSSDDRT